MLAIGNRFQYQFAGRFIATDQLDNNIDVGIIDNRKGIIADTDGLYTRETRGIVLTSRGMGYEDTTTGTPGDFRRITIEDIKCTATHCANAQQANINRIQLNYPPETFA